MFSVYQCTWKYYSVVYESSFLQSSYNGITGWSIFFLRALSQRGNYKIIISITQYHHPFSANINIQFNIHSEWFLLKIQEASRIFIFFFFFFFCNNIKILLTTWDKTWSQDIYTTLIFILYLYLIYTSTLHLYTLYCWHLTYNVIIQCWTMDVFLPL